MITDDTEIIDGQVVEIFVSFYSAQGPYNLDFSAEVVDHNNSSKIIYTLQHPQAQHHLNGMVGSWTDWDLSELGVQQAQRIALNLKAELAGKSVRLLSSDLKRAWHTAEIVGEALEIKAEKEPRLRERYLVPVGI